MKKYTFDEVQNNPDILVGLRKKNDAECITIIRFNKKENEYSLIFEDNDIRNFNIATIYNWYNSYYKEMDYTGRCYNCDDKDTEKCLSCDKAE